MSNETCVLVVGDMTEIKNYCFVGRNNYLSIFISDCKMDTCKDFIPKRFRSVLVYSVWPDIMRDVGFINIDYQSFQGMIRRVVRKEMSEIVESVQELNTDWSFEEGLEFGCDCEFDKDEPFQFRNGTKLVAFVLPEDIEKFTDKDQVGGIINSRFGVDPILSSPVEDLEIDIYIYSPNSVNIPSLRGLLRKISESDHDATNVYLVTKRKTFEDVEKIGTVLPSAYDTMCYNPLR